MTTFAQPIETTRLKISDGYTQSDEVFGVQCTFEAVEDLEENKLGRLGRLTWEFKTADTINRNRRMYPAGVVAMAVQELQGRIEKNIVFGNIDHPSIFDIDSLSVRLSDAAIKIVESKMVNATDIRLVADILDNKLGEQLVSVLNVGGNPGVSQRALARWREPTDDEREKFNIPDDHFIDVAESLRLITYDVVSEPGFADAEGAKVTENLQGEVQMKTVEELKAQNPALYALVIAEGKAEAKADMGTQIEKAIEEAKTGIIDEATKPLNEKITKTEAEKQQAVEALAQIKPVMVELGIVNEKITDADAASKVATSEAMVKTLEQTNKQLEDDLKKANDNITEFGKASRVRMALETVSTQYKTHPAHDHILKQVAPRNIEDAQAALDAAKQVAEFIESVNPNMKQGTDAPNIKPSFDSDVLSGLLLANPANAYGKPDVDQSGLPNTASEGIAASLANGLVF